MPVRFQRCLPIAQMHQPLSRLATRLDLRLKLLEDQVLPTNGFAIALATEFRPVTLVLGLRRLFLWTIQLAKKSPPPFAPGSVWADPLNPRSRCTPSASCSPSRLWSDERRPASPRPAAPSESL